MKNKTIKQLVVNAMYIALLVVSSFISVPINQIPYTLQTLVVFIVLLMLDCKNGIIVFLIYTVMGLIGLPVFSGFTSGFTPTLGFIIGFIISPIIYLISNKIINIKKDNIKQFTSCFISLIFIDIIGLIYFTIYFEYDIITSVILSILPYILIDILKIVIAIIITKRIKILLNNTL
jgi:biotin transport system substrate-specific component